MWVQSLRWDDPLQQEMATYTSVLAWRIPWTEEPCGVHRVAESDTTEYARRAEVSKTFVLGARQLMLQTLRATRSPLQRLNSASVVSETDPRQVWLDGSNC